MAYDRYDTRRDQERGRYSDYDRDRGRDYGRRDERGFFERAGDEISSWFGDDEAERRRREDERMGRGHGRDDERMGWGWGRERGRDDDGGWGRDNDRYAYRGSGRDRDRGWFEGDDRGGSPMSSRDSRSGYGGYDRDFSPRGYGAVGVDRGYSPGYVGGQGYTGGYGGAGYGAGSDRGYGSSGYGGDFGRGGDRPERSWSRGGYHRSESRSGQETDPNYQAWRERQLDELDRDYDEYRREHQEKFESDFGKWRENRQQKRGLLGQIREHMDVVGSDGDTIGKVDCVKGDRVILTKSDSDDNRHRSFKCSLIDSVEGDQVRLDVPAEEAKSRLRDEDRGFFGRDDEENQSTNLERSFAGTYR
jgi:hypothetical protein